MQGEKKEVMKGQLWLHLGQTPVWPNKTKLDPILTLNYLKVMLLPVSRREMKSRYNQHKRFQRRKEKIIYNELTEKTN